MPVRHKWGATVFGNARRNSQERTLTAPVSGTVQQLVLHTLGGIVQPAQALMAIVPDGEGIEIEAEIENRDIGFVREGQEAVVKLETFPFTRYGTIPGTVLIVSNDAVERNAGPTPQAGEGSAASNANTANTNGAHLAYLARIRLGKDTMVVDGKTVRLSPGMAASVEIKTGTRKIIEFLLSPLLKMAGEAGRER